VAFLEFSTGAIERLLPHVQLSKWTESSGLTPGATWASNHRRAINVRISLKAAADSAEPGLNAQVVRRKVPAGVASVARTLDNREHDICNRVVKLISRVLTTDSTKGATSLDAIRRVFDETVVAEHLQNHHGLEFDVAKVLDAVGGLAQQTYENKSLAFGCVLDPTKQVDGEGLTFPDHLLVAKKYRALTDGFRTAYSVSTHGRIVDLLDLDGAGTGNLAGQHFFPEWSEPIARQSREGRCGLALTHSGDILVFDEGNLRFTYRFGNWQYWNHGHLLSLLKGLARVQRVQPKLIGKVVASIYRAALDVSFRRTGALFVVLRNRNNLRAVVRPGDAIGDNERASHDREFDRSLSKKKFHALPRCVAAEISGLDGAVVLANSGELLAYGAVLNPRKAGRLRGTEGSRTKAAIGASNYGLAVKVSSDGDITVFAGGKPFIKV
jgi:hypothetical protein